MGASSSLLAEMQPMEAEIAELAGRIYFDAGAGAPPPRLDDGSPLDAPLATIVGFDDKADLVLRALGEGLTRRIVGFPEDVPAKRWAFKGALPPLPEVRRLCVASTVVACFSENFNLRLGNRPHPVLVAWFTGANPTLGDASPAEVIRKRAFRDAAPLLAAAAIGTLA